MAGRACLASGVLATLRGGKLRARSLPTSARGCSLDGLEDGGAAQGPGFLEAFGAVYHHLVSGTKCTGPDALAGNERTSEIDLSHEFPPERREAQVDRSVPQPPPGGQPALSVHRL
ncbi:unnamed protein product [Prorocentrum cordatum]|uniref:Uncharacterized protein n=1 Tax=Prorocentrum cordatum TaxID=2364126 RepID=A0ABN9TTZ7_9DINO|nr:unnamed protein product [Polarella glacialis]